MNNEKGQTIIKAINQAQQVMMDYGGEEMEALTAKLDDIVMDIQYRVHMDGQPDQVVDEGKF